jgi:hypothetical protein
MDYKTLTLTLTMKVENEARRVRDKANDVLMKCMLVSSSTPSRDDTQYIRRRRRIKGTSKQTTSVIINLEQLSTTMNNGQEL